MLRVVRGSQASGAAAEGSSEEDREHGRSRQSAELPHREEGSVERLDSPDKGCEHEEERQPAAKRGQPQS